MKIKLVIGDKEIIVGELDRTCSDCKRDIETIIEKMDNQKIYIYKSTIHGETSWHLEVI